MVATSHVKNCVQLSCLNLLMDFNFLQNIRPKILKSQHSALTIFTLAVYMNGWKEVKAVQFVARYGLNDCLYILYL